MFDFGKKKYKQGMVEGAKPFEEKFRKQEEAIREVGERIDKGLNEIGENIDVLYEHLTSKEKADLYNLNTPLKIENLDEEEAQFLIAALFELSSQMEASSKGQQTYLRAVMRTLNISQPQTSINLEAIDAISDINAQKAILQTVLEYLYLGDGTWNLTENQELFIESFNLSSKNFRETVNRIETICSAVGYQGLAEKYGYVPVEDEKSAQTEFNDSTNNISNECICNFLSAIEFEFGPEGGIETKNFVIFQVDSSEKKVFRLDKHTGECEEHYYPHFIPPLGIEPEDNKGIQIVDDLIIYYEHSAFWAINIATLEPPQIFLSCNQERFEIGAWSVSDRWLVYLGDNSSIKLYDHVNKCYIPIAKDGIPMYAQACAISNDTIYFWGRSWDQNTFFDGGLFRYVITTKELNRILNYWKSTSSCYMRICHDNLILSYAGTYHEKCSHIVYASLADKKPQVFSIGDLAKYTMAPCQFYQDGIAYVDHCQPRDLHFIDFQKATTHLITSRNSGEFDRKHHFTRIENTMYFVDTSPNDSKLLGWAEDLR